MSLFYSPEAMDGSGGLTRQELLPLWRNVVVDRVAPSLSLYLKKKNTNSIMQAGRLWPSGPSLS